MSGAAAVDQHRAMTRTIDAPTDTYALERSAAEYERLRTQARVWEDATERILDRIGLAPGARCLDAGCGPGETMRLTAERVGPRGGVLGIDLNEPLGAQAIEMLHGAGHRQCKFARLDLSAGDALPAQYDLVYTRLLLFHLPDRVAVLRRLWDAVAPGGCLVVQDYDIAPAGAVPALDSYEAMMRTITDAFTVAGADVRIGVRLGELFAQAGVGAPDGTDVAGRLETVGGGRWMVEGVYRSLLPVAPAHRLTDEAEAAALLAQAARDGERFADRPMLFPLMMGAWKRKPAA
jgi:ubiquinone/menaquinone biosynthesis C-methylase UbiE